MADPIRIVLTGDNHLAIHERYVALEADQLAARRERFAQRLDDVVEHAIDTDADLFVHCGDCFDVFEPPNETVARLGRAIDRLQCNDVTPVMVVGNHDLPSEDCSPQELYEPFIEGELFTNVEAVETRKRTIGDRDVALAGVSFDDALDSEVDPLGDATVDASDAFTLLVTHYGVEDHSDIWPHDPIISTETIERLEVDLLCTGHIHERADFVVGDTQVVVPGPTGRRTFSEGDLDVGFYDATVHRDGTVDTEYVPIDATPMRSEEVSVEDLPAASATDALVGFVEEWSDPEGFLQVRLTGPAGVPVDADLICSTGRSGNSHFELVDERGPAE